MGPIRNQLHRSLLALSVIVTSGSVVLYVRAKPEYPVAARETRSGRVTVHAAGRGRPLLNLQDGREMSAMYRGDREAVAALENRTARSRSLTSADFDHNGTPDVVAGYGYDGGGLIALQRGNPDAFAPVDEAVFSRLQHGYDPAPLLPWADVYRVPVSPDFLVSGNFNADSDPDLLVAVKGGALYLLAGDGRGGLRPAQPIALPGAVTALAAGQFRAADQFTDIAVGVSGPQGNALLIFDAAEQGFTKPVVEQPLAEPASAIEFGGLDDDAFTDVAAAAGQELLIMHGWGRKTSVTAASRIEYVHVGMAVRGLAVGEFAWDREGHSELAALSEDGAIQILQNTKSDTRPFTAAEAARRTRGRFHPAVITRAPGVESLPAWQRGRADGWRQVRWLPRGDDEPASFASARPLLKSSLSYREMNDLIVVGGGQPVLEIVHPGGPRKPGVRDTTAADGFPSTILDLESAPVAVLALPRKLNGVTDVLMLNAATSAPSVVANAANATIHVDRTDDNAAASGCADATPNDCSVRGAFAFANDPANTNTTIDIPAGTYILSINGASVNGCSDNSTGDLSANQSMTVIGAGAASTIIRQTGNGPASDGDRVMCLAENFALNLAFDFSGFTITGGRDGASGGAVQVFGGGGIIGGEKDNVLTLTHMVFSNNWTTGPGLGGGAIQITGGSLNIVNSTFGGTAAPGLYTDRSTVANANSTGTSGAGVMFTPSAPMHTGGVGNLTITGSTFSRNAAASVGSGGAGVDLVTFAFAAPGGIGSGSATIETSTFSNNQALPGNGGAILVESLATTVRTSSLTNNAAGNRGGGIYVGGGGLVLDGTSPSVTLSGNTAGSAGSSISTAFEVTVNGTNVTLGGDIEVTTGGVWTNSTGSALAPTNVVVEGGTLEMNDSTMNVGGNLLIGPAPSVGATFAGGSGTVNIAGNLTYTPGGSGPATSFDGGTGTFNFNGTGPQNISLNNGASITFNNLIDSNGLQPLTLNNSLAVNGTLTVGPTAALSPAAATVISGSGTLTGTGTARASRISATPDFLSQYTLTNKTLTNLTIDYNGLGAQTVNNTPAYGHLVISGTGTKTLQGNTTVAGNLTINPSTLAGGAFNLTVGGNWTNIGTFAPGTGTVMLAGGGGTQTLTGNTTFYNLTLNNPGPGATINFGAATITIGNDLTATAGTMDGGTSTVIFTGVTDNIGAIAGAAAKNFYNLQVNSPAAISHAAGANITIENNYTNAGTFTQAAALTTTFATDNNGDGVHSLAGAGATTFGNLAINGGNTVTAGAHSFSVGGAAFTATGGFTGGTGTVTFNGGGPQTITGDGAKSFSGLFVNNANGVQLANGTGAVDASAGALLTLNTDLTVVPGAILQQSGTSTGAADVLGTVRRTDLGGIARSFGNLNNAITINSGTPPTQLDLTLVKAAPGTFPAGVKVVPRDFTLSSTGGSGISATVKLRYIDPVELAGAGITESNLVLWQNVGGTWVPQGGTADTAANFVSQTGISSFSEWAIAEGSDLTLSKANSVSGAAVTGQAWNWTLTASNSGAPATFAPGQTILSDNLPNSNLTYGTPTVQNVFNVTGSGNIGCSIAGSDLTCAATGGSVTFDSNLGASNFSVVVSATPQAAAAYQNPRSGGGTAQIDPANAISESIENNNSPAANTVTVARASTTTAIASDDPDASVAGQAVTVQWTVAVTAPGSIGAALTGNVTVSDGTNQCVAAVSAGQCAIVFDAPGAKSLTATYAGDANYNGSASTPATPHQVNKADTTTTITSDAPDPSAPGQSITVQWTVTANAPGAGTPTGIVTVSDGVDTCAAAVATGQCTLALNTAGARTLTATYAGDTNFNTSADTESHQTCAGSLVTTTADSGAGSLRAIIAGACDGAAITFDAAGLFAAPQTITLTSGEILIDKNLGLDAGSSQIAISGNHASRVFHVNAGKTFSLTGLTVTDGSSASGGAILNEGTLTIVRSTLSGNTSTGDGGAISNSVTGALTLVTATISGNGANGDGGGVSVLGGTFTSINSTITNNRADNDDNATGTGGGTAVSSGIAIFKNTIVADNFNEDGVNDSADDISGAVDAANSFNNLIGPGADTSGLTDGVNRNIVGVSSGLGPLGDNGGPTETHALVDFSRAIDAGDDAFVVGTTDQRGAAFGRFKDGPDAGAVATTDIGAVEADPTIEQLTNKTTPESTPLQVTFEVGDTTTGTLFVTATSTNAGVVTNGGLSIGPGPSGSTRTLTITPVANASGTTTIRAFVSKQLGGVSRGTSSPFVLTVTAVNDPPTLNPIGNPAAILEDAAMQTVNLSGITAGGGETQTLTVTATSDNTALVPNPTVNYASANATGSLTYTPAPNASGSAVITVTVNDGSATVSRTFVVTVNAVADTPSISNATTPVNTQTTAGLVVNRDAADGAEVTHVKIVLVTGGTLFQADGTTPIATGSFITIAQGAAGLRFTPVADSLAPGHVTIRASIGATDAGLGGNPATADIIVTKIPSTTTAATSLTPSAPGQSVTFTATVMPAAAAAGGTVQFRDGTTALGAPVALAAGVATFTTTTLLPGLHHIAAEYSGNAAYLGSTAVVDQAVTSGRVVTVAADAGAGPRVRRFGALDGSADDGPLTSYFAFEPSFTGGVRVAEGDIDGDGIADVIAGAGAGGPPRVVVHSGATGGVVTSFLAFDPAFTGGVYVAAGDVDGDGRVDIITGSGAGVSPQIRVFSGASGAPVAAFAPFQASLLGGVRVAAGDVDGDGRADIVAGSGTGPTRVRVFSGASHAELLDFDAYPGFAGGVFVAAGDVNGDGYADVITGADAGAGAHVRVFNGRTGAELSGFFPFASTSGVRVAAGDVNGDGRADVITALGPGGDAQVRVLDGLSGAVLSTFNAADGFAGGVFVATAAPENRAVIDLPANGATVRENFRLLGWALKENAAGGTGVDTIHVWAFPDSGAPAFFLGAAVMGDARPDVAAIFGDQYLNVGYHLDVTGLAEGTYDVRAFVHDASTGLFSTVRTTRITVRLPIFDVRMHVDLPRADAIVGGSFRIAGWTLETAGSPIEAVHVWVQSAGAAAPRFLGAATLGDARPDVTAAFGPSFTAAGFHLDVTGLADGPHTLLVFPKVLGAPAFGAAQVVPITVGSPVPEVLAGIDRPATGETPGTFRLSGWALTLDAPSAPAIELIRVWALPVGGGTPRFLGAPALGGPRPDNAAVYGAQYERSGFSMMVNDLPAGTWDITVSIRPTGATTFTTAKVVRVTVR